MFIIIHSFTHSLIHISMLKVCGLDCMGGYFAKTLKPPSCVNNSNPCVIFFFVLDPKTDSRRGTEKQESLQEAVT